jgi:hypothetical protein
MRVGGEHENLGAGCQTIALVTRHPAHGCHGPALVSLKTLLSHRILNVSPGTMSPSYLLTMRGLHPDTTINP